MTALLTELSGVERALAGWLPAQRWYGAKGRPVRAVRLRPVAEFADRSASGGPRGLLAVAEVRLDTETQHYQVPLGLRPAGDPVRNPITTLGDLVCYDASTDEQLVGELLALIGDNGVRGPVRFVSEPRSDLALVRRRGLAARPVDGEQSNTSVVIGKRFILKLFRRLTFGVNPDLAAHRALDRAGIRFVAPLLGAIEGELDGAEVTFGMLNSFYPDSTDGWRAATTNLAAAIAGEQPPDFADQARLLAQAVGAVHAGLADRFGTAELSGTHLTTLREGFLTRLDHGLRTLPELRSHASSLRRAFGAVNDQLAAAHRTVGRGLRIQRVHGDLHLGQVLSTPSKWLLLDFEGEPAAPAAQRLARHSPLRDVAGMLRSFDYAAHHRPVDATVAGSWLTRVRDAFCTGYAETTGLDPRRHAALLSAYELDKAVYEVGYEAHHRPDWLPIPLAAIRRLTGD